LNAPPSNGIRSATACGSRTTVYAPGSIAVGFLEATAFCAAREPSDAGSIRCQSREPADAHPDPVPSGSANCCRKIRISRAVISEQSFGVRDCARQRIRLEVTSNENVARPRCRIHQRARLRGVRQQPLFQDQGRRCDLCNRLRVNRFAAPAQALSQGLPEPASPIARPDPRCAGAMPPREHSWSPMLVVCRWYL
jgi:hypothetical protein